jgi:hypothetical protein
MRSMTSRTHNATPNRGYAAAPGRDNVRFERGAPVDVHVFPERRRARVLYSDVREVTADGLGFFSREILPVFSQVVICSPCESKGHAAKIIERVQTIGGYIFRAVFEAPTAG